MFTNEITISGGNAILRQAVETGRHYLINSVRCIDETFEKGYAEVHPDLVASLMMVMSKDLNCTIQCQIIQEAVTGLVDALNRTKN